MNTNITEKELTGHKKAAHITSDAGSFFILKTIFI